MYNQRLLPTNAGVRCGERDRSAIRWLSLQTLQQERLVNTELYAGTGLVFYLFAIFCAYWAQTTGRSALVLFFMG